MTSQPGEEAAVELPQDVARPEDDDHDLLTFGEAGARACRRFPSRTSCASW